MAQEKVEIPEEEYRNLKAEISKTLDHHLMIRRAFRHFNGELSPEESLELGKQFHHFFREYGH